MSNRQNNLSPFAAFLIIGCTAMVAMIQPGFAQVDVDPSDVTKHPNHHHSPSPKPADTPGNSPDDNYIKHIPKKVREFVENCTKHISDDCADEIVAALFLPDKKKAGGNVDAKCCHQLVEMGLKCHEAIVKVFIGLPDVRKAAKTIKKNTHAVFRRCENIDKKSHHAAPPGS